MPVGQKGNVRKSTKMKQFKQINPLKMAEIMNRLDFFRALSVDDKRRLIDEQLVQVRSYQSGEVLIEHGGNGDEFFMLMSGHLNILTKSQTKVAELKPGQFFGEVAFILNEQRTANVVAEDDVVVMVIDHKTLKLMPVALRDRIKDKLIAGLIKRVAELNEKLEQSLK